MFRSAGSRPQYQRRQQPAFAGGNMPRMPSVARDHATGLMGRMRGRRFPGPQPMPMSPQTPPTAPTTAGYFQAPPPPPQPPAQAYQPRPQYEADPSMFFRQIWGGG